MKIEVPAGVGVASLAVVGQTARVMLRSDCRYLCIECGLSPIVVGCAEPQSNWAAYWHDLLQRGIACEHIDEVRRQGIVRFLTDEEGRQFPEFVWSRRGVVTRAPWPASDDPDGAIAVLAEAIQHVAGRMDRGFSWHIDDRLARMTAIEAIRRMRAKGYVVVPEWLSRAKQQPADKGATRLFDFDDEGGA